MSRAITFLLLILSVTGSPSAMQTQEHTSKIYTDPLQPVDARVEDLLSRMTLREKIGQMTQLNIGLINMTGKQSNIELNSDSARKYIIENHIGSFLNGEAVPAEQWYAYIKELQTIAVEETRLGIPVIYGIDHIHGASYLEGSTIFPHNLNLANTFNPDLAEQAGRITATESGDIGHHWNFSPVLDLGRNPAWPRFYETFGESYHLASEMGVAYVTGYQGTDKPLAATGKHFLGYSDPKSGWDRTPVDLSDQTIAEFHVPSFRAAIEAGLRTIMVNSAEINGVPVHASGKILTGLLRNTLGFDGVILTDWNDIGKLVDYHHTARDYTEATRQAIEAGIDMSMTPGHLRFNASLLHLVNEGVITEERINESVRRILTLKFELGLFEQPYPRIDRANRIGSQDHRLSALKSAQESLVLLENNGILPLNEAVKSVLVVGPSANSKRNLSGGWTLAWQGGKEEQYPEDHHTIYSALKDQLTGKKVTLADWNTSEKSLMGLAQSHDAVVIAFGEEPYTEFAGNITDMSLPEEQYELIRFLHESSSPLVGIYVGGRPRLLEPVAELFDALIFAGLPGFEGAPALGHIITGKEVPSGKLAFSYPRHDNHMIPYNHKPSDVYVFNMDDANDIRQEEAAVWQWSFGHGLSYTEFTYSDLNLSDTILTPGDSLRASVTVTNTGDHDAKESVLWFLKDHVGSITRPVKELKHFEKIWLKAGESATLHFIIKPDEHLSFPHSDGKPVLEEGYFTLEVGGSAKEFYLDLKDAHTLHLNGK